MWILFSKVFGWLVYYVLPLCVAVIAVIAAVGAWFYYQDNARLDVDRHLAIERFMEEEQRLLAARQELEDRLSDVRRELTDAQMQLNEAQRLAHNLRTAAGFWERLFVSREERERREEELRATERRKQEAERRLRELEESRESLAEEVESTQRSILTVRAERSELDHHEPDIVHYAAKSWETVRLPVVAGIAALVAGPWIFKSSLFFLWAPLLRLTPPIVLSRNSLPPVEATPSSVSVRVDLQPGETLLIKEKFLQASDEGVRRRTKFVFNWRVPLSCLACGLVELIRMLNESETEAFSVTLSAREEPMTELALIDVPAGGSLVLRPRFLAGVILPEGGRGKPGEIRRHWRLFSLHAWITLRFRYFEFCGPCRLVVCGKRGVRIEKLDNVNREEKRARRTNQTATIGFTPQLRYHSIRAETFWSFFRGKNPLFDDLFSGTGAFVCQEIADRSKEHGIKRIWSGFWNGVLKIFGL